MDFLIWCFNEHKYLAAFFFPPGALAWACYFGLVKRIIVLTIYQTIVLGITLLDLILKLINNHRK